jgi:site-specific recombinase XerD
VTVDDRQDAGPAGEPTSTTTSGDLVVPASRTAPTGPYTIPEQPTAREVAALFLLSYKQTTRQAYAVDLKQWFAWCDLFDIDPLTARRPHVDAWAIHLASDGARPATLARKISSVRNFYGYAVDEGHAAVSPVPGKDKALHLPKVSRKSQTLGPDREESTALLAAAAERGPRDAAVVSVLLYQGLRASELCAVNLDDLSTQRGHRVIHLRRKGGEEQDQAMAPPAAGALDTYLEHRAADAGAPVQQLTGPLLLSNEGGRMTRYHVEWIVESCAKAAGLAKKISPHSLRHACTTILLDQGVPLRDIQVYLGHANSTTTERYDLGRQHLDKSPAYALTGVFG